jgi:3-dehydroquinate dehydratase/shikimate dehydrogenase
VLDLVRAGIDPRGARAAIVGAGGTARAAAEVLRRAGASVTLYARDRARAGAAAAGLDTEARGLAELAGARWDVLVQATPLGRAGESVVAPDELRGRVVVDAVYGVETPLVREARRRGLHVADGLDLLVAQAVPQCEHLAGVRPEPALLRAAARAWLERRAGMSKAKPQAGGTAESG